MKPVTFKHERLKERRWNGHFIRKREFFLVQHIHSKAMEPNRVERAQICRLANWREDLRIDHSLSWNEDRLVSSKCPSCSVISRPFRAALWSHITKRRLSEIKQARVEKCERSLGEKEATIIRGGSRWLRRHRIRNSKTVLFSGMSSWFEASATESELLSNDILKVTKKIGAWFPWIFLGNSV